jgi:hypothetical protein
MVMRVRRGDSFEKSQKLAKESWRSLCRNLSSLNYGSRGEFCEAYSKYMAQDRGNLVAGAAINDRKASDALVIGDERLARR